MRESHRRLRVAGKWVAKMPQERTEECRLHAEDCIAVAERMSDPQQKTVLLLLAKAWLVLARFVEVSNLVTADILPPGKPPTER